MEYLRELLPSAVVAIWHVVRLPIRLAFVSAARMGVGHPSVYTTLSGSIFLPYLRQGLKFTSLVTITGPSVRSVGGEWSLSTVPTIVTGSE